MLVVEDIYFLAMEAKAALERAGAEVIGPFAGDADAMESLRLGAPDCALLDVNLGEGASFDLARTLRRRGVPFLFFTGYDAGAMPPEFAGVMRLEKPVAADRLVQAVAACCRSAPTSG
jgi:DNA-binding response OmpR family regulator